MDRFDRYCRIADSGCIDASILNEDKHRTVIQIRNGSRSDDRWTGDWYRIPSSFEDGPGGEYDHDGQCWYRLLRWQSNRR